MINNSITLIDTVHKNVKGIQYQLLGFVKDACNCVFLSAKVFLTVVVLLKDSQ